MSVLRARLQALWGGVQRWYGGHPRRDQRIIVGVLVFALVCVAYLWGWVPLRDYRQTVADEISAGQDQLARAARILAAADSLATERESLQKRLKQARGRLLPGRGGTLGAAALQERTNSLAAEKGITVQSTQVMKEEALDPYRKVSVRLTLSGELKPFAELVSALEYEQQLALPIVEVNRRGAVAGAKGPRTLSATVEVTGFVLSEDAKGEETAPENGEVAGGGEAPKASTGPVAATGAAGAGAPTGGEAPKASTGPVAATGAAGAAAPTGPAPGGASGAAGVQAPTTTTAPAGRTATTTTRPITTTTVRPRSTTTRAPSFFPMLPRNPPTPPPAAQHEVTK